MTSRHPGDEALEKERSDRRDETHTHTHTKQPTNSSLAASTADPCPIICQGSRTPRHWKTGRYPAPSPDPTTVFSYIHARAHLLGRLLSYRILSAGLAFSIKHKEIATFSSSILHHFIQHHDGGT